MLTARSVVYTSLLYTCLFTQLFLHVCLLFTQLFIRLFIQNNIPIRGDPHILVVGDPGLGKSQVTVM